MAISRSIDCSTGFPRRIRRTISLSSPTRLSRNGLTIEAAIPFPWAESLSTCLSFPMRPRSGPLMPIVSFRSVDESESARSRMTTSRNVRLTIARRSVWCPMAARSISIIGRKNEIVRKTGNLVSSFEREPLTMPSSSSPSSASLSP